MRSRVQLELSLHIRSSPHRSIETAAMDGVSIRRCRKLSPFPHRFRSKLRRPIKKGRRRRSAPSWAPNAPRCPAPSPSLSESSLRRTGNRSKHHLLPRIAPTPPSTAHLDQYETELFLGLLFWYVIPFTLDIHWTSHWQRPKNPGFCGYHKNLQSLEDM